MYVWLSINNDIILKVLPNQSAALLIYALADKEETKKPATACMKITNPLRQQRDAKSSTLARYGFYLSKDSLVEKVNSMLNCF